MKKKYLALFLIIALFVSFFKVLPKFNAWAVSTQTTGSGLGMFPAWLTNTAGSIPALGTNVMSSTTIQYVGCVTHIPKTGTIVGVIDTLGSGTPGTTTLALYGVSTIDGRPATGTLIATGAQGDILTSSASVSVLFPINAGTGVSVTAGTLVAITVFASSTAASSYSVNQPTLTNFSYFNYPYDFTYTFAGVLTKGAGFCPFALKYSDGTYPMTFGLYPVQSIQALNSVVTTTAAGNMLGDRYKLPFPMTVCSILASNWTFVTTSTQTQAFILDTNSTNTVMASSVVSTGAQARTYNAAYNYEFTLQSPFTMLANHTYRAVVQSQSAGTLGLYAVNVSTTALLQALTGSSDVYQTQGSSTWTDTNTRFAPLVLVPCGFDNAPGYGSTYAQ